MKRKDYSDYLQDILDSINDTDDFVKGISLFMNILELT